MCLLFLRFCGILRVSNEQCTAAVNQLPGACSQADVFSGGCIGRSPRTSNNVASVHGVSRLPRNFPSTQKTRRLLSSRFVHFTLFDFNQTLFRLLKCKCNCCSITNFCWSVVLDSTWIYEACIFCPFFTVSFEVFEWSTIKFY